MLDVIILPISQLNCKSENYTENQTKWTMEEADLDSFWYNNWYDVDIPSVCFPLFSLQFPQSGAQLQADKKTEQI